MTEEQVAQIQTEAVCRAFERAKFTNMPKELREAYEEEDVQYVRISGAMEEKMAEGIAKGKAEGIEEGIAKGKAEGIEEGITKGKEEGKLEERYEMAREMLIAGESAEKIMKYTKLTFDELNTLT